MHKSQLLFILLLSFIFGIALGSFAEAKSITLRLLFIPPLVLIGVSWRRSWMAVFWGIAAIFFLFGMLRIGDFRSTSTFLNKFGDTNFKTKVYGYVDSEPLQRGDSQEFVFRVRRIKAPDYLVPEVVDEKTLVVTDTFPHHYYGEKLSLEGKVKLPKSYHDFDYISFLARDQIYTLMFRPRMEPLAPQWALWEGTKVKFFGFIFKLKRNFEESIQLAVKEPQSSFLSGILLGSRQDIPADLKEDFSKVGLTHILAISGYNIAIIGTAVSWLLLLFWRRTVAFWFSIAAIVIFTILTGASASVVRAAMMGGLVLLANNSGRLYNSKNALTLAAFLMILANPMVLRYDIGFQLSFLATLGLIYVAPLFANFLKKLPKWGNLREIFIITLSAQLMVLPLVLYYFHNFSLIAFLANIVILPLIPLAMLLGFLTGMAGMVWSGLGLIVGAPAWLMTAMILSLIKFFARIPGLSFQIFLSWPGLALSYLLLLAGLFYWRKRQLSRGSSG